MSMNGENIIPIKSSKALNEISLILGFGIGPAITKGRVWIGDRTMNNHQPNGTFTEQMARDEIDRMDADAWYPLARA